MKIAFKVVLLAISVTLAWGSPSLRLNHISQLSSTFTVGPGTVIAVHPMDVPFVGRCYAVKYKTQGGELIEIRHLRPDIPVVERMHGLLTYSTNPEMILNFRVIAK